jgi:hypothetical protein
MRYNIQIPGDDYIYVNGRDKVQLETFIQTIRDVNKSEKRKCFGHGQE